MEMSAGLFEGCLGWRIVFFALLAWRDVWWSALAGSLLAVTSLHSSSIKGMLAAAMEMWAAKTAAAARVPQQEQAKGGQKY